MKEDCQSATLSATIVQYEKHAQSMCSIQNILDLGLPVEFVLDYCVVTNNRLGNFHC